MVVNIDPGSSAPTDPLDLGIIGISEGNGHPYSFASIINGYRLAEFAQSEWDKILKYLEEADPAEFGFCGVEVTHAWTQDVTETERLCAAARIPHTVETLDGLIEANVDAVMILRDDFRTHLELARPFLQADIPVFLDKPLTMDPEELAAFEPFLRDGQLMSCSGMRYATELDAPRHDLDAYGDLRVVRGTVLFDWPRYGVHVLEAILSVIDARPVAVKSTPATHTSITIETDVGYPIQIDALNNADPVFEVDLYGSRNTTRHQLSDNFRAFRRTLSHFIDSVRTGTPAIPPKDTLDVIRTLIAGKQANKSGARVELQSIES